MNKKYSYKNSDNSIGIITVTRAFDTRFLPEGAEFVGNISNQQNIPDKKYREKWKVDNSGEITLANTDRKDFDRKEMLSKIRKYRKSLIQEADIEINKAMDDDKDLSAWKVYRKALRDITEPYKTKTGNPKAALDSIQDVEKDISWPQKPN